MMRYAGLLGLALLVVVADQYTKLIAFQTLHDGLEVVVLPVFRFSLVFNQGAAFGLFDQAGGWQRYFFIILATGFSALLLVWIRREQRRNLFLACGLALVLGGALGNLIDRVTTGAVIDFIVLHYQTWYFPTFNVADIAITLGAATLIFDTLFPRHSGTL